MPVSMICVNSREKRSHDR